MTASIIARGKKFNLLILACTTLALFGANTKLFAASTAPVNDSYVIQSTTPFTGATAGQVKNAGNADYLLTELTVSYYPGPIEDGVCTGKRMLALFTHGGETFKAGSYLSLNPTAVYKFNPKIAAITKCIMLPLAESTGHILTNINSYDGDLYANFNVSCTEGTCTTSDSIISVGPPA